MSEGQFGLDFTVCLHPFLLYISMSISAPAFIEGNSEPDGQCLHRMQMVLSSPALHRQKANPSLSPSLCSSSSFPPPASSPAKLPHIISLETALGVRTLTAHGSWPIHSEPAFVSKCPFCSLHNYHSENAILSQTSKKVAAVWATAQHTHPSPDCLVIPRRNCNCTLPYNCD